MDEDQGVLPQLSNYHAVVALQKLEYQDKTDQAEQAIQALVKTDKH
jgi:hypothetical protein